MLNVINDNGAVMNDDELAEMTARMLSGLLVDVVVNSDEPDDVKKAGHATRASGSPGSWPICSARTEGAGSCPRRWPSCWRRSRASGRSSAA